jgi:hypothetical protein
MRLTLRDLTATFLTALIVVVFAATHEGWGVPLVGDSRRWAAGAILLLGFLSCSIDGGAVAARYTPGSGRGRVAGTVLLTALGIAALALAIVALATGSLTVLSLLVAVDVALWAGATTAHALTPQPPRSAMA